VYGSLLAASVAAGAAPGGGPHPAGTLIALLVGTGVVFWLVHVYARLVGGGAAGEPIGRTRVRSVVGSEWPVAQAAIPPALAVLVCRLAGLSDGTAAWAALLTALSGQVVWAVVAVAATERKAAPRVIVIAAAVNLVLGSFIVALKASLAH
jgi:hypothetical protein